MGAPGRRRSALRGTGRAPPDEPASSAFARRTPSARRRSRAIWSTSTGYRSCTVASRSPPNASAETAGSASAISVRVAWTLWSSVAPQNACHQPPPWSRSGWTRPSATERCASSTRAKIARALPPRAGVGRRGVRHADQLVDVEPPRAKAAAGQREVRNGRLPDFQITGRQRPIGVADEEDRRRVLLPDELQRRLHRCAVLEHQPFKVTARADDGIPERAASATGGSPQRERKSPVSGAFPVADRRTRNLSQRLFRGRAHLRH